MTKDIVKQSAPLARQNAAFSDEQKQIVRDSLASGANEQEFAILWEMAKARNLDPLKREVFFVKRWDGSKQRDVWSIQISIDGLRLQAARTGDYDGQDETEFEHDKDGSLILARTKVYRKGISRPFVGTAYWKEYVQLTREGKPTSMWATKPHVMLGKCSESIALRKAFPDETAGLYSTDEMPEPEKPQVVMQPLKKAEPKQSPAPDPVIEAEIVPQDEAEPGDTPMTEEEIKYLEFDTRISAAEWAKEMETLKTEMKSYYERIGKQIPTALVSAWKAKRKEVP